MAHARPVHFWDKDEDDMDRMNNIRLAMEYLKRNAKDTEDESSDNASSDNFGSPSKDADGISTRKSARIQLWKESNSLSQDEGKVVGVMFPHKDKKGVKVFYREYDYDDLCKRNTLAAKLHFNSKMLNANAGLVTALMMSAKLEEQGRKLFSMRNKDATAGEIVPIDGAPQVEIAPAYDKTVKKDVPIYDVNKTQMSLQVLVNTNDMHEEKKRLEEEILKHINEAKRCTQTLHALGKETVQMAEELQVLYAQRSESETLKLLEISSETEDGEECVEEEEKEKEDGKEEESLDNKEYFFLEEKEDGKEEESLDDEEYFFLEDDEDEEDWPEEEEDEEETVKPVKTVKPFHPAPESSWEARMYWVKLANSQEKK